jgi:hypothetical protein
MAELSTIKVTPAGQPVLMTVHEDGTTEIVLMGVFEDIDAGARSRKVGSDGSPWPPAMASAVAEARANPGTTVNIADGGQIRFGFGAAVYDEEREWAFVQFDTGHPTRPGHLTPPAGLWQEGTPLEAALAELGQELIIVLRGKIGHWSFKGQLLDKQWVADYASAHDLEVDPKLIIELEPIVDFTPQTIFSIAGQGAISMIGENEFDSGSYEGILPFRVSIADDIELVDGEGRRDKTGEMCYFGRRTVYSSELTAEDMGKLTTKAQAVLATQIGAAA